MLSREDIVTQSAFKYARAVLATNYSPNDYVMQDAFPYTFENGVITKAIVAAGFNFDDEGKQAELGSDLKHRVYTVEYWVFGPTLALARNIANVLKFAIESVSGGVMPLYNFAVTGQPQFDTMIVQGVSTTRQIHPDPEPWQEFVFTTTAKVQDEYYSTASFPIT